MSSLGDHLTHGIPAQRSENIPSDSDAGALPSSSAQDDPAGGHRQGTDDRTTGDQQIDDDQPSDTNRSIGSNRRDDLNRPSATEPSDTDRPSDTEPSDTDRPSDTEPSDTDRPNDTHRPRIRRRRKARDRHTPHERDSARDRARQLGRRTRRALGRSRLRSALTEIAALASGGEDPGIDAATDAEIGPSVPSDSHVQQVLELAIRVGEVLLSSGETVADTTAAMLRVADAAGLPSCDVDITFTSITMCCHRGMEAGPVTTMRLVRYRSLDLTRLTQVADLVERLERGDISTPDASTELSALTAARHPYPRWLATLAWSAMAASIAVLLGGGAAVAGVAFAATGIIDRVGRLLNRAELPFIFQQLAGAALATGLTVGLLWLNVLPPGTRPSLVVAAALTVLLSGLSVVGAVRDAIDGFFLTATARAAEGAMFSAGLLGGVVLALKAGVYLGVSLEVADQLPPTDGVAVVRLVAAGLTSAMFALAGYTPLRFLPLAALTGSGLWGIYSVLELSGFGPVVATGAAAVCLGVGTGLLHRWTSVPRLVVTLAGITPLLPGLTAYRGFYQLGVAGAADGLVTIILAAAIGLALAGGVALGEWTIDRLTGRWVPRHTRDPAVATGPVQGGPGQ